MSAHNVVRLPRHKRVILAADTASYYADGVVGMFASKFHAVDRWPGVIGGTGNAAAARIISAMVASMFSTFDEAIAGIELELPRIAADCGLEAPRYDMVLAGWSAARQRAESYNIKTMYEVPSDTPADQVDALRAASAFTPFLLRELPDQAQTPAPALEIVNEASFDGFDDGDTPEQTIGKLRLFLEMQRHHRDVKQGLHWVGGAAEIATVTPDSVTIETVHTWTEDQIGSLIEPAPIADWNAFRVSIGLPPGQTKEERQALMRRLADAQRQLAELSAPSMPAGMSRQQRRAWQSQHGKLRSVG
jgi:hypothetical protein